MPLPIFPTVEELREYLIGLKKHRLYEDTKALADRMKIHINKEYPKLLIEKRRPSESEETFAYRKDIYKCKTNNPPQKVLNSLGKIRRSKDWMIKFPENKNTSIVDEETLESYITTGYPNYGSLEQWAFSELLNVQGIDANSYIAVIPQSFDILSSEYFKPTAIIFSSEQIIYPPDKGDYCLLHSSEKVDLVDDSGKKITDTYNYYNKGDVYYLINSGFITRYEQMNAGREFRTIEYINPFGEIPVFKIKAVSKQQKDNSNIQVTRLDPMIESLDEAAREYNDLQIVKTKNAHPFFWYIQSADCATCHGLGKVIDTSGPVRCEASCKDCGGSGKPKFSPMVSLAIKPQTAGLGQPPIPTPPAGFIQGDVAVMEFLDKSVKGQLYDALASVNFQFLDQVPLSISGDAKQVDREELNNFVYSFAEDMIWSIEKVIYWITEWRYYIRVPDKNKRREMLPEIPTPENFDLLPSEYLIDEISKAKTSKLNSVLVAALEKDFAAKKFYSKPDIAQMLDLVFELNPLPGLSDDEKMTRLSNKGITLEDYVISSNIEQFVKRAIEEDKSFLEKSWTDQMKIMVKYAQTKVKENTAKALVIAANQDAGNVPGGQQQPANGQQTQQGNNQAAA